MPIYAILCPDCGNVARTWFWRMSNAGRMGLLVLRRAGAPIPIRTPLHSLIRGKWAMASDVCVVEDRRRLNARNKASSNAWRRKT